MNNLVVARFLDGRLLKGSSMDVDPAKPSCHVRTDGRMHEVRLAELKALFFVRDLAGNPVYVDDKQPQSNDMRLRGSRTCRLTFKDGETIVGITHHFPPSRPFYFVLPMDPNSNNVRVLVNREAVMKVEPGPEVAKG